MSTNADHASNASSHNAYVADPNDLNEMARLISQDRGLSRELPQVFSDEQWRSFHHVLDIGCGPGGWILDMARLHPQSKFVGIDISTRMLDYARMLARAESVENVEFVEMDATAPLTFPDHSFDYINGRLMYSFLTPPHWPSLLGECHRILRPRGTIFVADYETMYSTSGACEKLSALLTQAGFVAGRSFSQTGRSSGFAVVIKHLLCTAGFQRVMHQACALDFSHGSEGFEIWKDDLLLMTHTFTPFVVKTGITTQEEIQSLLNQAIQDLQDPHFCALTLLFLAWATR